MIIDDQLLRTVINPRPLVSHKGTFGRVLLIGGLYPYGGAIIMAALACVNSGAGLVTVATDRDNISALHSHLPEAMGIAVTDRKRLLDNLHTADVVLIGSGLGDSQLAQDLLDVVLAEIGKEQILLIDGSALGLLAEKEVVIWQTENLILTPHQKEWAVLSGLSIDQQTDEANQAALAYFPKETILVAKSHATKVYDQSGRVGELTVGGPYQATGGMGDTLAGLIAGFVAQFREVPLFEAVAAATYLHSAIADDLSETAYVVLPTRISDALPSVMAALQGEQKK